MKAIDRIKELNHEDKVTLIKELGAVAVIIGFCVFSAVLN